MPNKTIDMAIIGAMTEEVNAMLLQMEHYEKHQHLQSTYYLGELQSKQVILFQSGIAKVNATLATSFILEMFKPRYVINIGSAGGLDQTLNIGDIVISSAVLHHDVDVTLIGCAYGQLPEMPVAFPADRQLIKLTQQAIAATHLNAVQGIIASGDAFVSSTEQIIRLQKNFPEVIAVDMEAAAVSQTCYLYNTPFVIIRAISDVVTYPENHVDFFSFLTQASENSAQIVKHLATQLR